MEFAARKETYAASSPVEQSPQEFFVGWCAVIWLLRQAKFIPVGKKVVLSAWQHLAALCRLTTEQKDRDRSVRRLVLRDSREKVAP